MFKKILASILAAASVLSMSAVASATENGATDAGATDPGAIKGAASKDGVTYSVEEAGITYGTVDCVVPTQDMFKNNPVVINPYGAAITTPIPTDDNPDNVVKNTSFIASGVYTVTNNDTQNGLKVLATTSIKSVKGLVIVDGSATKPTGWDDALVKKGGTKVDHTGDKDAAGQSIKGWNPLVSYDKVTVTYRSGDKNTIEYSVGGAMSTKQALNTAITLVGGTNKDNVAGNTGDNNKKVAFAAKGTNTATLLELTKKEGDHPTGYYTVHGNLNPCIDREKYAWDKETISLNIVLKLIPQAS